MTEKEIEQAVEQGVINALIGPPRNKWITLLLWALFGPLGIYKFYEGKNVTGILYILTFGLCGMVLRFLYNNIQTNTLLPNIKTSVFTLVFFYINSIK